MYKLLVCDRKDFWLSGSTQKYCLISMAAISTLREVSAFNSAPNNWIITDYTPLCNRSSEIECHIVTTDVQKQTPDLLETFEHPTGPTYSSVYCVSFIASYHCQFVVYIVFYFC